MSPGRPLTDAAGPAEPPGDALQRAAVRLAGVGLTGALLPLSGLAWPTGPIPWDAGAHGRGMAFGFVAVFILGFLLRILPRARRGSLPHPQAAGIGLGWLSAAAVLDGAGVRAPAALFLLWGGGIVALGWPLLGAWRLPRKTPVWFDGWIAAGLLGMAVASAGLLLGLAWDGGLSSRAPAAFLIAGATPITLGLAVRMLPPMAGVGPPDRDRAARAGRLAPPIAVAAALGLLHGGGPGQVLAALGAVGLFLAALGSVRGLRARTDGDEERVQARKEPSPTILRATARGAFLSAGVGLMLMLVAPRIAGAWSGGVHLVGLGFLGSMALGVASRVVPGFVRGTVRWPGLEFAPWLLLLAALGVRLAALVEPGLLLPSAGLLLGAWVLFGLQIQPCLHAPDAAQERPSRCPSPNSQP